MSHKIFMAAIAFLTSAVWAIGSVVNLVKYNYYFSLLSFILSALYFYRGILNLSDITKIQNNKKMKKGKITNENNNRKNSS